MTGYESKRAAAQDKLDSIEREALKLALEALSSIIHGTRLDAAGNRDDDGLLDTIRDHHRFKKRINAALVAITAIEEVLAQPAQAEQCNYPDCKCPTENPCLKGLAQPAQEPVHEALNLALEELAVRFSEGWHEGIKIDALDIVLLLEAAQALAQPAQEPICPKCKAGVLYECVACSSNNYPPQRDWVDLTDDEIDVEANSILTSDIVQWWRRLARAVLAKSKEKNG